MKNLEPTPQKIKKEREKGNLLKLDFLSGSIGFFTSCLITFLYCDSKMLPLIYELFSTYKLELVKNLTTVAAVAAAISAISYFSVCSLVNIVANKGLWMRKQKTFELASNIKTILISVRKALLQLIFMVSFTVIVFISIYTYIGSTSNLAWFLFVVAVLFIFLLVSIELALEPVFYKKKLMMDHKELHDEIKETEGDPLTKAAQKHAHRVMLYEEVRARISSCKLIIVG